MDVEIPKDRRTDLILTCLKGYIYVVKPDGIINPKVFQYQFLKIHGIPQNLMKCLKIREIH